MAEGESVENSADATVKVGRSVSKSVKDVWKLLVGKDGAEALLGPGAFLGDKGDGWRSDDGKFGVVRSYHPLELIRFSWHAAEDQPKTVVEVLLTKVDDATTQVDITHERVPEYYDTAKLARRWEAALDRLAAA
ncbi:MAG: SRPBCC domain-containing protein [Propionibacteriaceae bacterium]|jgi:uncharacterized protein YndB with AHSA1/START domain|nr:SRPBCC domain-containing protein [Propionibacteriaceae bacterium]